MMENENGLAYSLVEGMKPSVSDAMVREQMRLDASNAMHLRDQEQGLTDITAYLFPRTMAGAVLKNPITKPYVRKNIPDPQWWRKTRDAKNAVYNNLMIGGGLAAGADELYRK